LKNNGTSKCKSLQIPDLQSKTLDNIFAEIDNPLGYALAITLTSLKKESDALTSYIVNDLMSLLEKDRTLTADI
jgi:hypothetical protein